MATPSKAENPSSSEGFSRVRDLSFVVTVGLFFVWRGWRKWTHPIIDFGRELYVPWQIVEDKSLYSDLAYFNGPLSPHLNALAFRFFGTSLTTILVLNLLITTAVTLLIYGLVRKLGGRLAGVIASLLFLAVFATADLIGFGNYNFLTPYSHEMTHGILLSLSLIWIVGRTIERPSKPKLVFCGLVLGLIFLTKAEFFIASVVAILVVFGLDARSRSNPESEGRSLFFVLVGALVAPILTWLVLWNRIGAADAAIGVLGTWPYVFLNELSDLPFYRQGMGLDDPMTSLAKMSTWLAIYCIALGPAWVVASRLTPSSPKRVAWSISTALWPPVALITAGVWFDPTDFPRPLPLVVAASGLLSLLTLRRVGTAEPMRSKLLALICLQTFALVLLAKMALHPRFQHYGFALALPATLVLVLTLLFLVPEMIRRRGGYGPAFRLAGLLFLAVVGLGFSLPSQAAFRGKTLRFGEGSDAILVHPRFVVMQGLLERLRTEVREDETLLVLPEGVMLNFQLRRSNPTRFVNFMPPEFVMFGEDAMLADLEHSPPDVVVVVKRSTHEYGYESFGSGYGEGVMAWLADNGYRVVATLSDPRLDAFEFGRALILRKTSGLQ